MVSLNNEGINTMTKKVIVSRDEDGYKILVNYIKRGVSLHSKELANNEADKVAKREGITEIIHI